MNGLEGIKVVDLTAYVAVPACPCILGEVGTMVYRIESFAGDRQCTQGASWGMKSRTEFDSQAYDLSSMNRQWLNVNLKTTQGLEFMYRLIGDSDIVVTSFRDKALKKLGLDYETLSEKFPHIISGQMRGYGERGPRKDSRSFDITSYPPGDGLVTAFPQKGEHFEPANVPAAFGDWNASMILTVGILATLVCRLRSGAGDKVVASLCHCVVWGIFSAAAVSQQGGEYLCLRKEVPCPVNNCYQFRDGIWFLVRSGRHNKYFELVMRVMGLNHLIGNKEYNTLEVLNETGNSVQTIQWMEEVFEKQDSVY